MTVQKLNKLNQLERDLPEGLIVTAAWLEKRGYSRSLRSHYVASRWLEQPARAVFRRPRGSLRWEHVVISLQTLLEFPASIGGRTALDLQGYAHYLPHDLKEIHLYGDGQLPRWVAKLPLKERINFHNRARLLPGGKYSISPLPSLAETDGEKDETFLPGALRITRWGQWDWPLVQSSPERAILEMLDDLPGEVTFHLADVTMEGLVNLSPRRMQGLLEDTKNIKVKRLFFFFADRHKHRWLERIERKSIDLGSGKRMLVKGGRYDPNYQITVPKDFDAL
jgi:hypothetical protein